MRKFQLRIPRWGYVTAGIVALVTLGAVVWGIQAASSTNSQPQAESSGQAVVIEVGAISGIGGEALMAAREKGLPEVDIQWLQFSDVESVINGLSSGTGSAAIVPENSRIGRGVKEVAKLYSVDPGSDEAGTYILIAPSSSANSESVKALLGELKSSEVLKALNMKGMGKVVFAQ